MTDEPRKRYPIIGFVGMVLLVLGIIGTCADRGAVWPMTVILVGAIILVVALFTGNVKFLG